MPETWELLDEEQLHRGHLPVVNRTYRLPTGDTASWEVLTQGPVVCMLALTPDLEVVPTPPGPGRPTPTPARTSRWSWSA